MEASGAAAPEELAGLWTPSKNQVYADGSSHITLHLCWLTLLSGGRLQPPWWMWLFGPARTASVTCHAEEEMKGYRVSMMCTRIRMVS